LLESIPLAVFVCSVELCAGSLYYSNRKSDRSVEKCAQTAMLNISPDSNIHTILAAISSVFLQLSAVSIVSESLIYLTNVTFLTFKICALLGYYAASNGSTLTTFRDNVSVPYPMVKKSKTLKMGPIRCPETSVKDYDSTLSTFLTFEICALLRRYAASNGNTLTAFRDNVSVSTSMVKNSKTLNIGPIRCPETSVKAYYSTLRNIPEGSISHQHRGGGRKSRIILHVSWHVEANQLL
jgi:hypothetical protein